MRVIVSTAGPLPLAPLPAPTLPEEEVARRRQEIAAQLQMHRARRGAPAAPEPAHAKPARTSRVADSVAARFARSKSYRDFLAEEAERATRQAEAAAEVARRSADAIEQAQRNLLDEMERWERAAAQQPETPAVSQDASAAAAMERMEPAASTAGEPSLLAPTAAVQAAGEPAATPSPESATAPAPAASPEPAQPTVRELLAAEPAEAAVPLPANLIEFPRQLVAVRKARPRLAEGPLRDEDADGPEGAQLRIFEVDLRSISTEPAVPEMAPEWASIRLDTPSAAHDAAAHEPEISFAIPLQVAPLSRRMMSATVDVCCIAGAFLLAVMAVAFCAPALPTGAAALVAAAAALAVFTLLYLWLFFTFCDATPGMRFANIALCTFADENPSRKQMRRRVLALALALVPGGLGVLWAWLDDDRLGWHDRISHMYQRCCESA